VCCVFFLLLSLNDGWLTWGEHFEQQYIKRWGSEVTDCCVSPRSGLLQNISGLSGRQRPAGDIGHGAMGSPRRAGCDLCKYETVKKESGREKKPMDRCLFVCVRDVYLLVWSFSRRSGRGASSPLRLRRTRPGRSIFALFEHYLLITIKPRLLLLPIVIILTAALELLLGWNKLLLILLSVRVQVLQVVQKIPDHTEREASVLWSLPQECTNGSISGLKGRWRPLCSHSCFLMRDATSWADFLFELLGVPVTGSIGESSSSTSALSTSHNRRRTSYFDGTGSRVEMGDIILRILMWYSGMSTERIVLPWRQGISCGL